MRRLAPVAVGLFLLAAPLSGQTPEIQARVNAGLYVARLQAKDGGFRPSAAEEKSSLRATSSAVRTLKHTGRDVPDLAACKRYVESCFDAASGGFADAPGGKPDVLTTCVGLMAVVELGLPLEKYAGPGLAYLDEHVQSFEDVRIAAAALEAVGKRPAKADRWLAIVKKLANEDGTFGKEAGQARETGGAVVAVLRLGGKVEQPKAVVQALDAGQRKDGGFGKADATGSDLETTYRVLRAYHMLRARPADTARLLHFIDSCRNEDGGYGVAPGKPSSVSGTYYATTVLHWLEEK